MIISNRVKIHRPCIHPAQQGSAEVKRDIRVHSPSGVILQFELSLFQGDQQATVRVGI